MPSRARAIAKSHVEAAPEFLREQYADPEFLKTFARAMKRDAVGPLCHVCGRGADRTCRSIIHETLGAIGAQGDFSSALAQALGVSIDFARSAVRAHASANAAASDPAALTRNAERHLERAYRENPALAMRSPLRSLLAQAVEPQRCSAETASEAEAADEAPRGEPR